MCFLCGNTGHKAKQCTVVLAEKKWEFLAKRWKDSQSKKKLGVANLEVDEKEDEASTEGEDELKSPRVHHPIKSISRTWGTTFSHVGLNPRALKAYCRALTMEFL